MTRYRFDIECDDLGEYDSKVVEQISEACWRAMGDAGMWAYRLTISRHRPDEPVPGGRRYHRMTPELLASVADMVEHGHTIATVAEQLGVGYRQATRYIRQARADGLLP